MIPNFVDTSIFAPVDREAARTRFGLPRDKLVVLCCAAIRRFHKRIDHLLAEFATIQRQDVILVVAGGREPDTEEIIAEGIRLLGDRVRFLPDVPRSDMPDLYRAADLFALPSLHEMFGIALIEAMASGLPVVCHDTPEFHEICGPAGLYRDISSPGGLAGGVVALLEMEPRLTLGRLARPWIIQRFSETAIIPLVLDMYRVVNGQADDAEVDGKPAGLWSNVSERE
jgi:glycosyltransferase involved in cell wall biosynthesis